MLRSLATIVLACFAVTAADAQATFRIENHLNPAGDPTRIRYRVEGPNWKSSPFEFELVDGDYLSTGPPPGTYTATALLPPGWSVQDIQCVGPRGLSDFIIDVPNGRVTVNHGAGDEHLCAFTNRRLAQGAQPSPSPGVAPSPKPEEVPNVKLPRRPALIGVNTGRGYAEAVVRITRRSVIKPSLRGRGKRVLGSRRIVRKPGTYSMRVELDRERMRRMRRRGLERVGLTLRVAVTARRSGATHVFTHRVLVRL